MTNAKSINLSELSQYLGTDSGLRLGDFLAARTEACPRQNLFPDSDDETSFSFSVNLEKRKTLTENEQATQGVEQPVQSTVESLPQEKVNDCANANGGEVEGKSLFRKLRVTRTSLSAQKTGFSPSDRLRRSVFNKRASLGRRGLLAEFEETLSPSFSPHLFSTPIRQENKTSDSAQKIRDENQATNQNAMKDNTNIAQKLDSILTEVRAENTGSPKLSKQTNSDINYKTNSHCKDINNRSTLAKTTISNQKVCSADFAANNENIEISEMLDSILTEVRAAATENSRMLTYTDADINLKNASQCNNDINCINVNKTRIPNRAECSLGPRGDNQIAEKLDSILSEVRAQRTEGFRKSNNIDFETSAQNTSASEAFSQRTKLNNITKTSVAKDCTNSEKLTTCPASQEVITATAFVSPPNANGNLKITCEYNTSKPQIGVDCPTTPKTDRTNFYFCPETPCTNAQAIPRRTVTSVECLATPKRSHCTIIGDKILTATTANISVQTSPEIVKAFEDDTPTPRRTSKVNVTYCKSDVKNVPSKQQQQRQQQQQHEAEKRNRGTADAQAEELITDDEDADPTLEPEASNIPLNLVSSPLSSKRATRLSLKANTFETRIGLPCAHPLIVRSNRSDRRTALRPRVPLNKPPSSPINGEKFANELKQNLARMTNHQILDLRKRHSRHSSRKSKSEEQKQIEREIENEIAKRVQNKQFVPVEVLPESDMIAPRQDVLEGSPSVMQTRRTKGSRSILYQRTNNEDQYCIGIANEVTQNLDTVLSVPAEFGDSLVPPLVPLMKIPEDVETNENVASTLNEEAVLMVVPDEFRDSRNLTYNQLEANDRQLEIVSTQENIVNDVQPSQNNQSVIYPPRGPQESISFRDNAATHNIPRRSQYIYLNARGEISTSDDSDMITFRIPQTASSNESKPGNRNRKRKKDIDPMLKDYLDVSKQIRKNRTSTSSRRILYSQERESLLNTDNDDDIERPSVRIETPTSSISSGEKRSCFQIPRSLMPPPAEFLNAITSNSTTEGAAALDANKRDIDDAVFKKPWPLPAEKPKKRPKRKQPDMQIEQNGESTTVRRSKRGHVPAENTWGKIYLQLTQEIENKRIRAAQASLLRSLKKNSLSSTTCSHETSRKAAQSKPNKRDTSGKLLGRISSLRSSVPLEVIHEIPQEPVETTDVAKNKKTSAAETQKRKAKKDKVEKPFSQKPSTTNKRATSTTRGGRTKKSSSKSEKTVKKTGLEHSYIDLGVTPVEHLNTVFDSLKYAEHHQPSSSVHGQNIVSVRKCRVRLQRIKISVCSETQAKPKPTQQSSLAASSILSKPAAPRQPTHDILVAWIKQISNTEAPGDNVQIFHQMSYSSRGNLVFTDLEGIDYAFYDTEEAGYLGYLRFRGRQSKQTRKAKKYNLNFIVMSGQFKIVTNDEVGIFNAGDLVIIKIGNRYSIENLTDEVSIVMIVKIPG